MRWPRAIVLWGAIVTVLIAGASGCGQGRGSRGVPAPGTPANATAAASTAGSGTVPSVAAPAPAARPVVQADPLRVDGRYLRDGAGRAVLLRGLNMDGSAKHAPFLPWQTPADLDRLSRWGMNAVRLLIEWQAIEPQPGVIDQAYLDAVAQRVQWLGDRGIWVILDMHQDVYGPRYGGNGAPPWASPVPQIIPPALLSPLPWFVLYARPEVWVAYDFFWDNRPAPDGVGLQDHHAAAWAAVARRFKAVAAVVGYDLYNEPFYGSAVPQLPAAIVQDDPLFFLKLHRLADAVVLEPMLKSMGRPQGRFEQQRLAPFYDKVRAAIRAEDPAKVIFLEPAALANMGIPTSLPRPADPQTALIPHYYDPQPQDGQKPYDGDPRRMDAALSRLAAHWAAPMLLGEYGNIPSGTVGARQYLDDLHAILDRHHAAGFYWDWQRALDAHSDLLSLERAYPARVPGDPQDFRYDPRAGRLELRFATAAGAAYAPVEIVLPQDRFPRGFDVSSSDAAGAWGWTFDPASGRLAVGYDPQASAHQIVVTAR